ncbi:Sulfate-binding protein precursor [Anatilimnocola aggregata]|uniref:Sulfate-binding protein n=1 Tax=Anatilimnocola aggregata TaxID=2528021 RepID=A0A517YH84_9BACT|nr:sulfate ABC transporter substrate-binding protein [Anatilimnocola aggregata]QDU29594.1 Sulfate-binding protein precursor [Anatilimnocola aggregata]
MTKSFRSIAILVPLAIIFAGAIFGCSNSTTPTTGVNQAGAKPSKVTLLNVSYDPTREFYVEFNKSFADVWKKQAGQDVTVEQSHGGSGKQARAVIDGLEADVVTLSVGYDLSAIARKAKLMDENWQSKLPHNSAPYTSTIVFLVRKGNPKGIKDWGDLTQAGIEIITANPKTGGGSRWNYLAAWGSVLKRELGDLKKLNDPAAAEEVKAAQAKAREFISQLYKRVTVLDSGARGSTNTFTQRGLGDVLLTWENEAFLAVKDLGPDKYEIVVPSLSILAEPPVAVVTKVAQRKGTLEVAEAYLQHLYSPAGQQLAAKHYYRPAIPDSISDEQRKQFLNVELFTIDDVFGGWDKAQAEHFDDGGVFDLIYQPGN